MNNANERIHQSDELLAVQRDVQAGLDEYRRADRSLDDLMAATEERVKAMEQRARESQIAADARVREAQARAEELAQQKANSGELPFMGSFRYDTIGFSGLFNAIYGERTSGNTIHPPATPHPLERIRPAEAARQRMLSQMDVKLKRQIESYGSEFVAGFIEEVEAARQADPELTDWKIHLGYRRSIMAENPDLTDVEKVKLSDILMTKVTSEGQPIPSNDRAYFF